MANDAFTIWCSGSWKDDVKELLERERGPHRLLWAADAASDDQKEAWLREADVVVGQIKPEKILALPRLKWIHVTSAGYTPYDRDDVKTALRERGGFLTNSSHVYDEPCAQHVVAMMLALSRSLLPSFESQRSDRSWEGTHHKIKPHLLNGETVLLLGFGAIGKRITQLLVPFEMNVMALRRHPSGDEPIEIVDENNIETALSRADHVINVLPENDATRGLVSAAYFETMKPGARFYNVGRGATVDQDALLEALQSGHLSAAYLDVTTPEPLPADHPLWSAPHCYITPHIAGNHADNDLRSARHFLEHLRAFERGEELRDRVF